MKILNLKNMADFLPKYPEHKIVLFDNNPIVHSERFERKTNAKLWYHFAPDVMLSPEYLREKGGIQSSDGAQAVRSVQ